VSLPAQTAYGSACVCCGLALLFRMAAPFIVTMGDIDSDDDSVLTADSAATAVCENQLAAAEPQVVEDEQSETPTMSSVEALRKKKRMKTMLLLWTELWAEESSLVHLGIAPSQASRAKSKHLRDSINFLTMSTGKDALGYPCGADFVNHMDLRTLCAASTSCSFVPEADKLDMWYDFCQPFGEVDFDPHSRPPWHSAMAPVAPGRRHDWHVLHYDIGCVRAARMRQGAHWWRVLFRDVSPSSLIKHWHLPASRLIHRFPVLYKYARNVGLLGGYCAAIHDEY